MACTPFSLGDCATGIVDSAFGGVLQSLADAVEEAVGQTMAALGSFWLSVPTPGISNSTPAVSFLRESTAWYVAAAAVLAVIVAGGRMAWERRAAAGRDLLQGLVTLVLVAAGGATAIGLLTAAADGFSTWIVARSVGSGEDLGENFIALIGFSTLVGSGGLGSVVVITLGLLAMLASVVQIMLIVARSGMLIVLAGVLPLAAAMGTTPQGRAWFQRSIAWTVAFILYKPAAAIIYSVAFTLSSADLSGGDGAGGLVTALTGLMLMILALFALPALMRFVTPLVAATAGGAGLGAAAGAAAMVAAPDGRPDARREPRRRRRRDGRRRERRPAGQRGPGAGRVRVRPGRAVGGGFGGPAEGAGAGRSRLRRRWRCRYRCRCRCRCDRRRRGGCRRTDRGGCGRGRGRRRRGGGTRRGRGRGGGAGGERGREGRPLGR